MKDSRKTSCRQLIHFIRSLQRNGEWVKFYREKSKQRPISHNRDINNSIEKKKNAELLIFANDFNKKAPHKQVQKPDLNQSKISTSNNSNYYVNIYANNKFKPKMNTDEYKNAASNAYKRRMTYNPKESINGDSKFSINSM